MEPQTLLLWRRKHKLSQGALAKHLGKGVATVARWERGEFACPDGLAADLAAVERTILGVNASQPGCITPKSHSRLYYFMSTSNGLGSKPREPREIHPLRLFPGRWESGEVPIAFLDTAEYRDAVQAYTAAQLAEQEEGNRRARQYLLDNPPVIKYPHGPTCACDHCVVLVRNGRIR